MLNYIYMCISFSFPPARRRAAALENCDTLDPAKCFKVGCQYFLKLLDGWMNDLIPETLISFIYVFCCTTGILYDLSSATRDETGAPCPGIQGS